MSEIQSKASLIPEISLAKNGQTVSLWYILRLFSLLTGIPSTPTRRKGLLSNFPPISPTPAKTPFPPHPFPPKTGKRGIAHLIGHSLRLGPLVADGPGCHMLAPAPLLKLSCSSSFCVRGQQARARSTISTIHLTVSSIGWLGFIVSALPDHLRFKRISQPQQFSSPMDKISLS